MTSKLKIIIKSLLLVLILIVVFLGMIFYLVGGPIAIDQKKDKEILQKMINNNHLNACSLKNYFTSDELYYIAECVAHYYVYDKKGIIVYQTEIKAFNNDLVDFETDDFQLSLGYYNQKFVYVLKNSEKEILLDYHNYDLLREFVY